MIILDGKIISDSGAIITRLDSIEQTIQEVKDKQDSMIIRNWNASE